MFDFLVVGAGFAGSVIAERLASQLGKRVAVCDQRPHVGGNAYDYHDAHGLLVHKYGPHIFHTASARVFRYLSQFTSWRPYEHRVLASVDGALVPFPINRTTINQLYGLALSEKEVEAFFALRAEPASIPATFETAIVSKIGRELYTKFFRDYSRKQWGIDPAQLDASVAARVPARTTTDDRYFTDEYQFMPRRGYTAMFERMLDHPNIRLFLGVNYTELAKTLRCRHIIYTGPIDAYFDYCFGPLPYRSLEFRHETHAREQFQPAAVINYPNAHGYTRITELKYLTGQRHALTSIVYEYPRADGEPYYPVPCRRNRALYERYLRLAEQLPNVSFIGRLGTYRYYNMDQVVAQALALFERLAGRGAQTRARDVGPHAA